MDDDFDKELFSGTDPFDIFKRWLDEAKKTELNDPEAMALASVDQNGMPNVRIVLLRIIENESFVFFSNYNSKKGLELMSSRKVAFNIHWKSLRRQVRVRGSIEKENGKIADNYFENRPEGSKIGAWASKQSEKLENKKILINRWKSYEERFRGVVPRPSFWGGFRIKPVEIEFWSDGQYRMHDRFLWKKIKNKDRWETERLSP
jgi:pyridoxamine 5'-phosphate oxidase